MSLRAATTSRHALALLLAGHRHAPFLAVRGEKRCRPMTGKQEGLADAVARNANAVGSRRAGRAPGNRSLASLDEERVIREKEREPRDGEGRVEVCGKFAHL